jgi:hypothetical protein
MQSENTADLAACLAKAQAAMKAATFNKTNPHFKNKYADLAAVLDAIRKPLADNGLSVTQTTEIRDGGGFVLVTTLRHASGQWVASEYPLPIAAKPQELGSALTYARRYSLSAIACIAADEDDDAEGARTSGQTASVPKASPIKPEKIEPPVDPETGEITPHPITAKDEMAWGGLFVAAIGTARDLAEVDGWLADNAEALSRLESAAPKVHARVMARVEEKQKSFSRKAA